MAVGVVIGAAFATVVSAFTKDLLTPLIGAIVGKPDFSAISFTINGSVFAWATSSMPRSRSCWLRQPCTFSW